MDSGIVHEGGCLCGKVRWQTIIQPLYSYHCHCRMCQRVSGAAFITGCTYPFETVEWTGVPGYYQSSENAKRIFCSECGSSIDWQWRDAKISLFAGSFDHPECIEASAYLFKEGLVSWVKLNDGLPCYERYSENLGNQDQGI